MQTDITLLPGRLLVSTDPPEDRTSSGILYPDVEKVYACQGYVLLHQPLTLNVDLSNKRIVFSKWSNRDFEWNGTTLSVLREANVLAVFYEEKHMTPPELKAEISNWIDTNYPDKETDIDLLDVGTDLADHLEQLDNVDTEPDGA